MMQLFYSQLSPYARKCRVVILEKGLQPQVELVETSPMDNSPQLLAVNPLGRVPVLVTKEGLALCESPVICEYLDMLTPESKLIPADGMTRIDALALAALGDGIMDSAVACVLESRRPEDKRYLAWVERKEAAIYRTIDVLAKQLPAQDIFHIGVISAVVALDYVSFRVPHMDWRNAQPALANWHAAYAKRPSLAATAPR